MTNPQQDAGDGRAARWRGQREKRRSEFVERALVAIAEEGPDVSVATMAVYAEVARTRIYRHFEDSTDLRNAVARRVAAMMLLEYAPVITTDGAPRAILTRAARTHLDWVTEHANLYRYLMSFSPAAEEVRRAITTAVADMLRPYLDALGTPAAATPLANALIGMVESVALDWIERPGGTDVGALTEQLAAWAWALVDTTMRGRGVVLDPDLPLPAPGDLRT
ncbi:MULTISPECIES: TetR/AcrR family transcriptional regulator [Rhodococcus]|uniref:TetR family transcriptional regulator n=1 Tax=Rhodococcus pseudokoreensis TaxID=2811421 RepID=A0A974W6Q4_9NOCA|nr:MULTISPECIES: TetR family transcriptional regulator [Rhodococcus]MBV6760825.1 TetR family transcriptional regulator [Rhodococcus opacus]QSE91627.1 TetR family transcriptional regulator [Rhodococcus pseudokoreensis]